MTKQFVVSLRTHVEISQVTTATTTTAATSLKQK